MNKLFKVVIVIAIVVIIAGFYRGWLLFSSTGVTDESQKTNVSLTVDREKLQEDVDLLKHKTEALTESVKESVSAPTAPADGSKSTQP